MSVRVQLDKPHAYFTNLDVITGKVILNLPRDETISAIVVKLEGESKTRLSASGSYSDNDPRGRDRPVTELEVHKLLYKFATVFPPTSLQQATPSKPTYTLAAGLYEYPFQFKIPFNNNCSNMNTTFTNLNVRGPFMELARDTDRHVKKTLPPTLSGFPGEAEIRYFVKVTVQRAAFFKENYRAHSDFKFFPIEPPRPAPNRRESYARRQHQFAPPIIGPTRGSLFRNPSIPEPGAVKPPMVSIDGRLPDPAIITCNEPLPLRILIKKLNDSPEVLFLRHLQIELVGNTNIRAHELVRQERMSWILVSLNNIQIPLTNSETPRDKEVEIDSSPWKSVPLPNTIAPSFDTCNLSRFYELEIKLGLSYGKSVNIKNEIYLQPLLMPVQLYSGIRPPPELLAKMSRPGQKPASLVPPLSRPPSNSAPPSPTPLSVPPPFQPGPPSAVGGPPGLEREEAPPPSYEDAIAEDIGPVDGPRRDYLQPERTTNVGERKRSGLGGRWGGGSGSGGMDERLFP